LSGKTKIIKGLKYQLLRAIDIVIFLLLTLVRLFKKRSLELHFEYTNQYSCRKRQGYEIEKMFL